MAAKKNKDNQASTDMSVLGATIGSIFSIAWVLLTGLYFLHLLTRFKADAALLSQLVWPAVVLALGVPLIVFVWFGGSSVVMGLAKLRKHLDKLDEYVSGFDEIEAKSSDIRQNMDSASSNVTSAANTFSANIERFEQDVRPLLEADISRRRQPDAVAAARPEEDLRVIEVKRRLGDILTAANNRFYEALDRKNQKPGKGRRRIVVAPGGSDKYLIAAQLVQDGFLSPEVGETLVEIFTLDMNTRPTGRKTLTDEALARMEAKIAQLPPLGAPEVPTV